MNERSVFDEELLLDKATREYLLGEADEFIFEIRKKKGIHQFYERLDKELSQKRHWKIKSFRRVKEGMVQMPRPAVLALSREDLLGLRPNLRAIKQELEIAGKIWEDFRLHDFLKTHYHGVLRSWDVLSSCLEVLKFLVTHREEVAGFLSRQIPHGQSTKMIGKEPLLLLMYRFYSAEDSLGWEDFYQDFKILGENAEFRFYAPRAIWQDQQVKEIHGIVSREWDQAWEFPLKGTLIVENYQTFSYLVAKIQHHLLVWGQGWRAAQIFGVKEKLPEPYYYWGDLDREGLEILNVLASRTSSEIRPLLMDMETFLKHRHLAQKLKSNPKTFKKMKLFPEVYEELCRKNLRIEQEQVSWPESWEF